MSSTCITWSRGSAATRMRSRRSWSRGPSAMRRRSGCASPTTATVSETSTTSVGRGPTGCANRSGRQPTRSPAPARPVPRSLSESQDGLLVPIVEVVVAPAAPVPRDIDPRTAVPQIMTGNPDGPGVVDRPDGVRGGTVGRPVEESGGSEPEGEEETRPGGTDEKSVTHDDTMSSVAATMSGEGGCRQRQTRQEERGGPELNLRSSLVHSSLLD